MANVDGEGRQWTEEEARRLLAACARSGLSMRAFAMRSGLRPRRLYWWMKRLRLETIAEAPRTARRPKRTESAPRFVPVVVKNTAASAKAAIVIRRGATTRMEIDPSAMVSPAWVAAVMLELERDA
jgi:transposase-like protein